MTLSRAEIRESQIEAQRDVEGFVISFFPLFMNSIAKKVCRRGWNFREISFRGIFNERCSRHLPATPALIIQRFQASAQSNQRVTMSLRAHVSRSASLSSPVNFHISMIQIQFNSTDFHEQLEFHEVFASLPLHLLPTLTLTDAIARSAITHCRALPRYNVN